MKFCLVLCLVDVNPIKSIYNSQRFHFYCHVLVYFVDYLQCDMLFSGSNCKVVNLPKEVNLFPIIVWVVVQTRFMFA